MNKNLTKKQEALKKKVGCPLTDCGKYFTFVIEQNVLALADIKKRIYRGRCTKCHKSIKLNAEGLLQFQQMYGKTNIQITKSTFDNVFEVIKDEDEK